MQGFLQSNFKNLVCKNGHHVEDDFNKNWKAIPLWCEDKGMKHMTWENVIWETARRLINSSMVIIWGLQRLKDVTLSLLPYMGYVFLR
jgi:hypothetical protein